MEREEGVPATAESGPATGDRARVTATPAHGSARDLGKRLLEVESNSVLSGCAMDRNNAILVQFIAIPAIVATLATLSIYRGLSQALSKGEQVTGLPAGNSFFTFLGGDKLGLPVSVWILILVTIVLTL